MVENIKKSAYSLKIMQEWVATYMCHLIYEENLRSKIPSRITLPNPGFEKRDYNTWKPPKDHGTYNVLKLDKMDEIFLKEITQIKDVHGGKIGEYKFVTFTNP